MKGHKVTKQKTFAYPIIRWDNGKVIYTAHLPASEKDASEGKKKGLAVRQALDDGIRDFSFADLTDADLNGAILIGAILRWAILRGAILIRAILIGANLSFADLSRAILKGAELRFADLSDANLSFADLSRAILKGAELRFADLRGAILTDADLTDAYISNTCLDYLGERSDGCEFYAQHGEAMTLIIAGCRYLTLDEAEAHWRKTRGGTPLGRESLAFVAKARDLRKERGYDA